MEVKKSFNELVKGDTPVLVDFYADWCGPCKAMAPVLENLASELGDQVKIIKINVDKNQAVAAQYKVRSIPTFLLFRKGKIEWQHTGMTSANEIKQIVSRLNA